MPNIDFIIKDGKAATVAKLTKPEIAAITKVVGMIGILRDVTKNNSIGIDAVRESMDGANLDMKILEGWKDGKGESGSETGGKQEGGETGGKQGGKSA